MLGNWCIGSKFYYKKDQIETIIVMIKEQSANNSYID
jgi:hypothetical protein